MAIFDKPFSFGEMLRRTIFKGRPNFFNAKDFNKELEILHTAIEVFNGYTGVKSTVDFTVQSISQVSSPPNVTRDIDVAYTVGYIDFKGTRFNVGTASNLVLNAVYPEPNQLVSPREVHPPSYIVLKADLNTITYALNPTLCGIQSDEVPATAPSVDVEQYSNVTLEITNNLASVTNLVCVLATIVPRYDNQGVFTGNFGFIHNTVNLDTVSINNYFDNNKSILSTNKTIYEALVQRTYLRLGLVANELQLIRRFNLGDLSSPSNARKNLGIDTLVNRKQLVQDENLKDVPNVASARFHLGLGNTATANFGVGSTEVLRGDALPIGTIVLWTGNNPPTNWVICDGTNGTPDLRGRVPVGKDSGAYSAIGTVGGSNAITLVKDQIPRHVHGVGTLDTVSDSHGHRVYLHNLGVNEIGTYQEIAMARGNLRNLSSPINNFDANTDTRTHKHSITGETENGATDGLVSNTVDIRQPFYTVAFIMFKGYTTPTPALVDPNQTALTYPNFSTPDAASSGGQLYDVSDYTQAPTVGAGVVLLTPKNL